VIHGFQLKKKENWVKIYIVVVTSKLDKTDWN